MEHRVRLAALCAALAEHRTCWGPSPFRESEPAWVRERPELAAALAGLDDATVAAFTEDPAAAHAWLAAWLPGLGELAALARLPVATGNPVPAGAQPGFAVQRDVPGRKAAQIDAFASAVGAPAAPLLEACAGKGHLGRRLLAAYGGEGEAIEIERTLCQAGETLAGRLGVAQHFVCGDIHDAAHDRAFAGRHVLALHACGDLHRRVLGAAAAAGAPAIDVAPCCYQRSQAATYRAETVELAALGLDRNALQLAVTETVTASRREAAAAARQQVWKLAFVAWRERFDPVYRPFMPVPAAWWREGLAGVLRRLSARAGLAAPGDGDLAALEAEGARRWRRVQRLQLVRFAFRRALELALLADLAAGLEAGGYAVRLAEFCPRRLTPRNVLLSARR